jgi:hypothetical protein
VVLVKSIIDTFASSDVPISDKTIKALTTTYCKDVGVRVTVKASLSGQHLDVNYVLGVLEALGLVKTEISKQIKSGGKLLLIYI